MIHAPTSDFHFCLHYSVNLPSGNRKGSIECFQKSLLLHPWSHSCQTSLCILADEEEDKADPPVDVVAEINAFQQGGGDGVVGNKLTEESLRHLGSLRYKNRNNSSDSDTESSNSNSSIENNDGCSSDEEED